MQSGGRLIEAAVKEEVEKILGEKYGQDPKIVIKSYQYLSDERRRNVLMRITLDNMQLIDFESNG